MAAAKILGENAGKYHPKFTRQECARQVCAGFPACGSGIFQFPVYGNLSIRRTILDGHPIESSHHRTVDTEKDEG
jgi:hypothetical protein